MKASLLAGTVVGLATGAWMFAKYAAGLHDDPGGAGRWTGFLALAFPVLGAYWLARRIVPAPWTVMLREGLVFGAVGGIIGGAAIYLYFTVINPGFSIDGQKVDAGGQALMGLVGSLVLGTILTLIMAAIVKRRRPSHG